MHALASSSLFAYKMAIEPCKRVGAAAESAAQLAGIPPREMCCRQICAHKCIFDMYNAQNAAADPAAAATAMMRRFLRGCGRLQAVKILSHDCL